MGCGASKVNYGMSVPVICKHCHLRIAITSNSNSCYIHLEGHQQGKHTCAIEPYGYHAEPIGTRCSTNPANPCMGSKK